MPVSGCPVRLMLTVLSGMAEFERDLIRARAGEGRGRATAAAARPETEAVPAPATRGDSPPRPSPTSTAPTTSAVVRFPGYPHEHEI
jgi:hypothetical protein